MDVSMEVSMSKTKTRPLRRLIIRFPDPLYRTLKAEAEATAIPMAILVRQAVARWAASKAVEHPGAS